VSDTSEIDLQDTTSPDYVNSVALIRLARRYNIDIKDRFLKATTVRKRVKLRDWLYNQVQKTDPNWKAEY